jgi:recombination protein RecT
MMLGYRGMISLASRSRIIIKARLVHEKDEFEYELGTNDKIYHKQAKSQRGEVVAAYAIAYLQGVVYPDVFNLEELEEKRAQALSKIKSERDIANSSWVKYQDEMYRKCPIRRLFNMLPINPEIELALTRDDRASMGEDTGNMDYFDGEFSVSDEPGITREPVEELP